MRLLNTIITDMADTLRAVFHDAGVLMFFIVVPLAYPLIYSWVYTREVVREVPVAVVDLSQSRQSRAFIDRLDAAADVAVAHHCADLAEAQQLVGRQEAYGIVYIPADYARCLGRGEQAHVSVYCDMAFMLYYKALTQATQTAAALTPSNAAAVLQVQGAQAQGATGALASSTASGGQTLQVHEVQMFNTTGGYGNFIIPGVLMLVLQQTLLLGIGMLQRRRISSLAVLLIYMVMAAYNLLLVPQLFGFVSLLHAWDTLVLTVPYLLACIALAKLVALAVRQREQIMLLVVFSSVPLLFLSGVSWPQSAIPEFWQWLARLIPSTFGIQAFVRMNTMGARLTDIIPELTALCLHVAAYTAIARYLAKHQRKQQTTT